MNATPQIHPVLISGGTGTGLWPLSREAYPKQFLPIHGTATLLQQTLLRTAERSRYAPPIVVANDDHRFIVADQLRQLGLRDGILIVEPTPRGTAPAIAVAALHLEKQDPDALMLVMPVDHAISDDTALSDAFESAAQAARLGWIVLIGVQPTAPVVRYGYIRGGAFVTNSAQRAEEFVEKPDEATATAYVADGRHFWNSGIIVASARQLLAELERHAPAVCAAARAALANCSQDLDFVRLDPRSFGASPSVSVDRVLLEHTDRAAVVKLDAGWTDLGSWSALYDVEPRDADGNVIVGEGITEASTGCHIRSEGPLVAAVGVEDLVIVATDDVVLVTKNGFDREVRHLIRRLKRDGKSAAVAPRRVYCPWGFYESLNAGHRYQVKRITVNPGAKLSLQKHYHRAEHWVVVNGTARVTRDDEEFLIRENESVYLPLGAVHRLENPGKVPLNLVEVQSGAYLGEDDIVRIEDVYRRA